MQCKLGGSRPPTVQPWLHLHFQVWGQALAGPESQPCWVVRQALQELWETTRGSTVPPHPEPAGSSVAKAEGLPEPDPPAEAETSWRGQPQLLDIIVDTSHHPLCCQEHAERSEPRGRGSSSQITPLRNVSPKSVQEQPPKQSQWSLS